MVYSLQHHFVVLLILIRSESEVPAVSLRQCNDLDITLLILYYAGIVIYFQPGGRHVRLFLALLIPLYFLQFDIYLNTFIIR